MDIDIVKDWGSQIIKVFDGESSTLEAGFRNKIKGLNYEQIKHILTWIKAEITWSESKIWKAKDKSAQALLLINQILNEAEFNKKNLSTKPRKHQQ